MVRRALGVALAVAVLAGACTKDEPKVDPKAHADGLYLAMTATYMKGDFAEAHKLLDQVKALAPDDPRLPAAEGELLLAEAKLADALEAFKKAAKLEPKRATTWSRIGYIQALLGDRDAARISLTKALELNPKDYNALEAVGDLELKAGKLDVAVQRYLQASEASPDPLKAELVMRAVEELARGGLGDQALAALEEAVKKGIKSVPLLSELGDRLVQQGRLNDALAAYTEAAKASKDDPTLWELVGELDVKLDKPADAEAAFRESLRMKDRGVVHVALARLCQARKDDACLKAELDLALAKSTGEELREATELAELLASVGRKPDAYKLLKALADEEGQRGNGALQLRAAQLARDTGDKEALKALCARALTSDAGVARCP